MDWIKELQEFPYDPTPCGFGYFHKGYNTEEERQEARKSSIKKYNDSRDKEELRVYYAEKRAEPEYKEREQELARLRYKKDPEKYRAKRRKNYDPIKRREQYLRSKSL